LNYNDVVAQLNIELTQSGLVVYNDQGETAQAVITPKPSFDKALSFGGFCISGKSK